jgi:hypothetical protein
MIFKHILLVVNPAVNGEAALERATVLTNLSQEMFSPPDFFTQAL